MNYKYFSFVLLFMMLSCQSETAPGKQNPLSLLPENKDTTIYETVSEIPAPNGYTRIQNEKNTFALWLGNVKLKKDKTVYLYNGLPKRNQSAQYAVLDISVGNQDLQQCADAVMRLRAEYLYSIGKFDEISFSDNDGKKYTFTKPFDRDHFAKYLKTVFEMCGTTSLSKQLKKADINNIQSGDVFIRGGFPGHTVIVVDVAKNKTGETVYMLAQSYMPAQDIHILQNPNDQQLSPWYTVNNDEEIRTPEYVFKRNELKGW